MSRKKLRASMRLKFLGSDWPYFFLSAITTHDCPQIFPDHHVNEPRAYTVRGTQVPISLSVKARKGSIELHLGGLLFSCTTNKLDTQLRLHAKANP